MLNKIMDILILISYIVWAITAFFSNKLVGYPEAHAVAIVVSAFAVFCLTSLTHINFRRKSYALMSTFAAILLLPLVYAAVTQSYALLLVALISVAFATSIQMITSRRI